MNYYNDNDPFIVKWLHNLIQAGLLPKGDIDERSIEEIQTKDLKGYQQCHFFCGIGGWPYALALVNWPKDERVWTGSCPCQPFSVAGKQEGEKDERHLWPEFFRLIRESNPSVIFGEQVASKDGLEWLDGISLDLEEIGYAVGAADLSAACVGSPQIRQRIYWVGYTNNTGLQRWNCSELQKHTDKFSPWAASTFISCTDGKQRRIPTEPALFPLVNGLSNKMGLFRGIGNSIVPQVAAEFIAAFIDARKNIEERTSL